MHPGSGGGGPALGGLSSWPVPLSGPRRTGSKKAAPMWTPCASPAWCPGSPGLHVLGLGDTPSCANPGGSSSEEAGRTGSDRPPVVVLRRAPERALACGPGKRGAAHAGSLVASSFSAVWSPAGATSGPGRGRPRPQRSSDAVGNGPAPAVDACFPPGESTRLSEAAAMRTREKTCEMCDVVFLPTV